MLVIGAILPVGTIIHSMLTAAQFATQYGDNWVLADGRSVTGTLYASVTGNSTIPDMRGAFLRSKGATYNPDGDLAVGTYSADKYVSHNHGVSDPSHTHPETYSPGVDQAPLQAFAYNGSVPSGSGASGVTGGSTVSGLGVSPQSTLSNTTGITINNSGGNETSPRSVTVNIFIRIN